MAQVGQSAQNGYAERVIRTIKEEEVYLNDYRDLADARAPIGRFIDDVYPSKCINSSLGYLTPAEFEAQWCAQQEAVTHPKKKEPKCESPRESWRQISLSQAAAADSSSWR